MQITNPNFYLFFLIVFIIYWSFPHRKWQNSVLLTTGLLFYAWVSPIGAGILIVTTIIEYQLIKMIIKAKYGERPFWLALGMNILVLVVFKYFNYFSGEVFAVLESAGLRVGPSVLQLALPVGLSFFTLRRLSYLMDIHKKTIQPVENFLEHALYVSYFPQIISGPIDRAVTLLPQFQQDRTWRFENFGKAWPLIVSGLFKKIVIADNLSVLVDKVFMLLQPTGSQVVVATFAFSIQVLADFAAYTDLSRALSYLLGIQTSQNFKNPFLAINASDFWNRWHITLSEWLRDYIFFPLRRKLLRKSRGKNTLLNIALPPVITMLISGIWHGSGWNYLLWGALHGFMLAGYQLLPGKRGIKTFWQKVPGWILFTALIQFSWLLFRTPSVQWLGNVILHSPWVGTQTDWAVTLVILTLLIFYGVLYAVKFLLDTYAPEKVILHSIYYAIIALLVIIFMRDSARDFIYGQF